MAVVTRTLVQKHRKQANTTATTATTTTPPNQDVASDDSSTERQKQLAHISTSWKRLFSTRQQDQTKTRWVPTLSGFLKAGDEAVYDSALFTTLHGHPGDLPLETIYDAFAKSCRARSVTSISGDMSKFLRGSGALGRSKSVSSRATQRRSDGVPQRTQSMSLELALGERRISRSISVKKPAPVLVSLGAGRQQSQNAWVKDGQVAEYLDGRVSIEIAPAELVALAITVGTPAQTQTNETRQTQGALGITILASSAPPGCKRLVKLQQHKRTTSQKHAKGSGYSTLYAKHLAAGSLPFSQQDGTASSILINQDTYDAIEGGASLYTKTSTVWSPESVFLSSLPKAQKLDFNILASSTEQRPCPTLIDAIAALPFSNGLAPSASVPIINTVKFIAEGGLPSNRLLQRLEGLVDKTNKTAPHLSLFGPLYSPGNARLLYREQQRLNRLACDPEKTSDSPADKAARVSRYVTLLERLIALVPATNSQDVRIAVQEALKRDLEASYMDAVAKKNPDSHPQSHRSSVIVIDTRCPESDARSTRVHSSAASRASARRSDRSTRSSVASSDADSLLDFAKAGAKSSSPLGSPSPVAGSGIPSFVLEFPKESLTKRLENVLKMKIPMGIDTIAFVARCVLVAWTESVEIFDMKSAEEVLALDETFVLS